VRAGASGANNGTDWTNAYTSLPATLTRGFTYYVADGSYSAYTFDDAPSGAATITVRKATAGAHGTDTGWVSTYGDGQAAFGVFTIRTSYLVIDGVFRNESDWFDGAGYGFAIGTSANQQQIIIDAGGYTPSNVTISCAYLAGYPSTESPVSAYALYANLGGGGQMSNMVYRRIGINGSSNGIVPWDSTGTLIEYCALQNNWSTDANHGDPINAYFSVLNLTIRFCKFRNCSGTSVIPIASWNTSRNNPTLWIYGNVMWDCSNGDGVIGYTGSASSAGDMSNSHIYNNTFVACSGYSAGIDAPQGSGNTVRNNLWVGNTGSVSISVGTSATITNNGFSFSPGIGTSAQTNIPTSVFTNYASRVLTPATEIPGGYTLAAPYNVDMNGVTRGTGGTWTLGAYEYEGG
jgi:hypothetical protein